MNCIECNKPLRDDAHPAAIRHIECCGGWARVPGKTRAELDREVAQLKADAERHAKIWEDAYRNGSPFGAKVKLRPGLFKRITVSTAEELPAFKPRTIDECCGEPEGTFAQWCEDHPDPDAYIMSRAMENYRQDEARSGLQQAGAIILCAVIGISALVTIILCRENLIGLFR
jgi:hypothetical protein